MRKLRTHHRQADPKIVSQTLKHPGEESPGCFILVWSDQGSLVIAELQMPDIKRSDIYKPEQLLEFRHFFAFNLNQARTFSTGHQGR